MDELTHHRRVVEGAGPADNIDLRWVRGEKGAAAMWFAMGTKRVLGYSVPGQINVHSIDPVEGWATEACDLLETVCWHDGPGQILPLAQRWQDHPVVVAYDAGDFESVYRYLELVYRNHFVEGIHGR